MADEATLFIETEHPIDFTVADGTAITKGALLQLNDPFTAIAPTASQSMVAGVAAADKIASDGVTKLAVYRGGVFRLTASGSITAGDPVGLVIGSNRVMSNVGSLQLSGSRHLGIALETATNGETLFVEVRPLVAHVAV